MYTRSYGSRGGGVRSSLPPDYGGTALVIRQPEPKTDSQLPVKNERQRERFREHGQRAYHESEHGGTSARKKLEKEDTYEEKNEYNFSPPFGGGGLSSAQNADTEFSEIIEKEKKDSVLGGLFSPENLKSDDLLLLGLIFLLFSSEEGNREALLILAVLYLSGL